MFCVYTCVCVCGFISLKLGVYAIKITSTLRNAGLECVMWWWKREYRYTNKTVRFCCLFHSISISLWPASMWVTKTDQMKAAAKTTTKKKRRRRTMMMMGRSQCQRNRVPFDMQTRHLACALIICTHTHQVHCAADRGGKIRFTTAIKCNTNFFTPKFRSTW